MDESPAHQVTQVRSPKPTPLLDLSDASFLCIEWPRQRGRPHTGLHSHLLERIAVLEKANRTLTGQLAGERRTNEDLRRLLAREYASRLSGR